MPTPISIDSAKMQSGKYRAFVDPPIIGIGDTPGDTVTWTNATTDKVTLWFPNGGRVFDPPPISSFSNFSNSLIDIPAGTARTLTIKGAGGRPGPDHGYYKYSVYCEQVRDFAQGNSEPGLHVP
jgi:hypothetical protein